MSKSLETEYREGLPGSESRGKQKWGITANGYEIFGDDENVLELDCGDGCATQRIY